MSSGVGGDEMVKRKALDDTPLEKRNLRSCRKRKEAIRKRERHFRNTIVLAPFHALKQDVQNKLKDLFVKGMLEDSDKRIRIPNNSLFQYEVTEVKTGTVNSETMGNGEEQKKAKPVESRGRTKRKKTTDFDQSKHCRCGRNEKKLANALDSLKRLENVDPSGSMSCAKNDDVLQQGPKKRKIQNDDEKAPKTTATSKKVSSPKNDPENSDNKKTKEKTKCREDGRRMPLRISNQKKSVVEKKDKNSVARNYLKYRTRSVIRRETKEAAEQNRVTEPTAKNPVPNVRNQIIGSEHKKKENPKVNSKESGRKVEEGAGRTATKANNLTPLRSDVSILFLEEIRPDKKDPKACHVAGKKSSVEELTCAVAEKCTCSGERKQQTAKQPEETAAPLMSEVTQMFHTLLRKSPYESHHVNNRGVDHAKKDDAEESKSPDEKETSSKKLERTFGRQIIDEGIDGAKGGIAKDDNSDEQRNLEPHVIIQEVPNESSSSDATSNGSWKVGDPIAKINFDTYTNNARTISGLGEGLDKPSSYVFGPRSPFHHIRESCEYGFAKPHSLSGDDAEVCDGRNYELDDSQ